LRKFAISWVSPSTVCVQLFLATSFPILIPIFSENAVSGDASAQTPGGIRIGTSALTSRDMKEADIKIVADFLHRAVQLSLLLQKEAGSKLLKDFVRVATVHEEGKVGYTQVKQLRSEVVAFASKWPLPGVDVSTLQKPTGLHYE
jgi:glycine hydroxymethyltransferase